MPEPLSTESTAFRSALDVIRAVEPRVADAIGQEIADQRDMLKLIASENYASPATLLAMGNWFSDKYAEGTVGRRFYAGCRNVDTVEALAAEHARELFGAEHAYAQPHSGIDANLVAFWAVLAARVEAPALAKAASATSTTSPRPTGPSCARPSATSACSACPWTPAATSPTASARTSQERCSTSVPTAPIPPPASSTTRRCGRRPVSSSR